MDLWHIIWWSRGKSRALIKIELCTLFIIYHGHAYFAKGGREEREKSFDFEEIFLSILYYGKKEFHTSLMWDWLLGFYSLLIFCSYVFLVEFLVSIVRVKFLLTHKKIELFHKRFSPYIRFEFEILVMKNKCQNIWTKLYW